MRIGQLLGSGRDADVYELDEAWVLRRYRYGLDATPELPVMSYLSASGYPVPRLGPQPPSAGPGDLVLQRLTGPTMLESLLSGGIDAAEGSALLARLLAELHTVPARLSPDPEDRILHLDLHPDNVMLTADGPVVIDWSNAEEGPPALDRAMSALILAQVAVDPDHPATDGGRELLTALMPHLIAHGGIPARHLADAAARRDANPTMSPAERDLIGEAAALVTALSG
ncbi:phosphotransferase [Streptomyces poriferorum]|uniref:Phosphotransferase n=1 Tax=Streptomyces poriferorum TaxID=2798799 RepID=A0ABY9ITF9_9ACTN|nr:MULTISPECIES: phosphotransferase [Streptomyces]MBW5254945.1 phosphotransferase [Streptomyces poriferorum]MBW5262601.1 phosphotransferase [Streptomyces poriferorum]MDP5312918.1 phosphotransferase [Streptomyces sp. Alt4]WLQ49253.1 phosphotransferase [Streptomyces sp. Alt1]WLQ58074.1 phosphotransferase [Streptomyces sp. Alt2]